MDAEEKNSKQTQSINEDNDVLESTIDDVTHTIIRLTSEKCREEILLNNLASKLQGKDEQSRSKELDKFGETQVQKLEFYQKLLSLLCHVFELLLYLLERKHTPVQLFLFILHQRVDFLDRLDLRIYVRQETDIFAVFMNTETQHSIF